MLVGSPSVDEEPLQLSPPIRYALVTCGASAQDTSTPTEFVDSVVSNLEDPIDPTFARSFVADTSSEQLAPELVDELANELMKVPAQAWKELFVGLLAYDDLVELERITAPTLLVWGDADGLVDRDMQALLAERIGGAELLVYHGVGHTPRWEDARRFATDVAAFVERGAFPPRQ